MNSFSKHAERELNLAGMLKSKDNKNKVLAQQVLDILGILDTQNHTEQSLPALVKLVNHLVAFGTLTPIDIEDDSWIDTGEGISYHKRNKHIIKDAMYIYFTHAVLFKDEQGKYSFGVVDGIPSELIIKKFPFTPKIIIAETVLSQDKVTIKNREQIMKKVEEQYNIPNIGGTYE